MNTILKDITKESGEVQTTFTGSNGYVSVMIRFNYKVDDGEVVLIDKMYYVEGKEHAYFTASKVVEAVNRILKEQVADYRQLNKSLQCHLDYIQRRVDQEVHDRKMKNFVSDFHKLTESYGLKAEIDYSYVSETEFVYIVDKIHDIEFNDRFVDIFE